MLRTAEILNYDNFSKEEKSYIVSILPENLKYRIYYEILDEIKEEEAQTALDTWLEYLENNNPKIYSKIMAFTESKKERLFDTLKEDFKSVYPPENDYEIMDNCFYYRKDEYPEFSN